nr:hypothetical protein GCM10020185_02520 [Pseudomonas brassicacearum subsp. brassicacearum]
MLAYARGPVIPRSSAGIQTLDAGGRGQSTLIIKLQAHNPPARGSVEADFVGASAFTGACHKNRAVYSSKDQSTGADDAPDHAKKEPWWASPPKPGQDESELEWGWLVIYSEGEPRFEFIKERPSDEQIRQRKGCRVTLGSE